MSTGTTSPNFTITGLVNGTSYTVSVRGDNAIGDGTASASGQRHTVDGAGRTDRRAGDQ